MNDMQIFSSKGILVENGSDLSFHDIRMEIKEGSAFEGMDSKRISYDNVIVKSHSENIPYLKLNNCQGVRITNCFQPELISLFVEEDEKTSDVYLMNNILPGTSSISNNKGKNIISQYNMIKN